MLMSYRVRVTDMSWSDLAQKCLEIAAFEQFEHNVVRPRVETDADQLHDVRVLEFTDSIIMHTKHIAISILLTML